MRSLRPGLDQGGYLTARTVAALASGVGGAIALVRVSGGESVRILRELTGRKAEFQPRQQSLSLLKGSQGEVLDEALVCFFQGPESFTGEDSFELALHGGEVVIRKVLDRLHELGAGQALPGEFSFRAVRNGKMSVVQAQAVADLITAHSDAAHALALENLTGGQRERVQAFAESLRRLMTLGELGIDFSDQDVDELSLTRLKKEAQRLREELAVLAATFERGRRIQQGIPVAILGLPNAGKSSLFNALLGEERSIVADVAGTTRDVVRETLNVQGPNGAVLLRLSDTAGLRSTGDGIEEQGIARSQRAAAESDVWIWVVDAQSGATELEQLTAWAAKLPQQSHRAQVVLVTKGDLEPAGQVPDVIQNWAQAQGARACQLTSVRKHQGIEAAAELLAQAGSQWVTRRPGEWVLTSEVQRQAVAAAVESLDRALEAPEYEFFASDIRQTAQSLAPLIGETPTDEILGRIFSQFCIGK